MTGATAAGAAPPGAAGALAGLRVVELGDGTAAPLAAKLLADFGADVVKVETGAGDATRRRGPFAGDRADPDASGLFHYLNANKRGIVLDLADAAGRAALERLLAGADVFVSNLDARRLESAGLAPAALCARHPRLVVTTISPFGSDGPWAVRRGDELVTYAMAGLAYSTPGMPDAAADLAAEPPLHPDCDVAETIAGLVAATATLAALRTGEQDGAGGHVELSQHAAVAVMQHRDMTTYSFRGGTCNRLLNPVTIGRMPNFYLPCKDGYVTVAAPTDIHWERLVAAMGDPAWAHAPQFARSAARDANWIELRRRITDWTMTLSGDELYALAEREQLPMFPFYPVRKVVDSAQARERGSVVAFELGGRRAHMPGAPVRMRDTPWTMRRPAPRLGEHTTEILGEIDAAPATAGRAAPPPAGRRPLPLAGLKVLDLGQFIAMPYCALWLAWMGAEVIVVESRRRLNSRTQLPLAEGHPGSLDASGYFNLLYSAKKSCTVDMTTPEGRALVLRLAGKVDIMVDNFSTGVLEKLGLGYAAVSAINPGIIAVSCGAFGRSGPMRHARGLHSAVNLFSGVADVTGYAGGAPRLLGGVLPDPLSGTYAGFAILAALRARRRSGRGQYIDLAMYEALLSLIPEAVIDYTLNGRDPVRIGNRDRRLAPHGIYPCADADTWLALSVADERDWRALCDATGQAQWRADPRFADMAARLAHVDDLDRAVAAWTGGRSAAEATDLLQAAGIAAGPVRRCDQLLDDDILAARGTVITIDHPVTGPKRQFGLPWRMDGIAFDYRRAPLFGEHTREVLADLAGVDDAEFARLTAAGALS
ncbi:MAG: CoA transferase [Burkholderiales bacterium]|nr:CoA transferase [Burkholderiales bacterium]